ncbi:hypothetical protein CORC01_13189 [Colletotrichum orchidophilum]|uniref:Uncharacterized protein n=1 Tax=Colletotrichum orchidophilum TaxID=1209926 RepID=A0A1G4AQX4_9PEZI|nr:uncharacterized protein CORC01_13189 [Colletotrichum orchidophilum]OHE91493.1 hypothetical protein CORC01_13189 [Colletotrichum orchidophilum]
MQLNTETSSLQEPAKQPGFEVLVGLAEASKAIIMLSKFYRISDVADGNDIVEGLKRINDVQILRNLRCWVKDEVA